MKTPTDFGYRLSPESNRKSDPNRQQQQKQQQRQQQMQQQQNYHNPNHHGHPPAKRSEGVVELIHFVRNYQGLQRETTDLRLKRHALLPGIGEITPGGGGGGHFNPGGEGLGSLPEEGTYRGGSYARGGGGGEGSNSDSDMEVELLPMSDRRRTPSPPPSNSLWKSDPNPLTSSSIASQSKYIKRTGGNRPGQLTRVNSNPGSLMVKPNRRITADVHQLPPITRHDIPDRPEAPTPEVPRDLERPSSRADRPSSARPWSRSSRRVSQEEAYRDKIKADEDDEWAGLIDYIE